MVGSAGRSARFDWDPVKDLENQREHGVSFREAQAAFSDPARIIGIDDGHSLAEQRSCCFGRVSDGILTVRFTCREIGTGIRITGAGYWRRGKRLYEAHPKIHG